MILLLDFGFIVVVLQYSAMFCLLKRRTSNQLPFYHILSDIFPPFFKLMPPLIFHTI